MFSHLLWETFPCCYSSAPFSVTVFGCCEVHVEYDVFLFQDLTSVVAPHPKVKGFDFTHAPHYVQDGISL